VQRVAHEAAESLTMSFSLSRHPLILVWRSKVDDCILNAEYQEELAFPLSS